MLSRRWIINYVLVVLILVFSYIGNRYQVQPGYQSDKRITRLKLEQVNSIAIVTADESINLQLEGSRWLIRSPIDWPANNVNISRLLDIINHETESRLPADEADLATLGLQFPKARLRLNDTEIIFGTTNSIGERRYLMIDSMIYLIPDLHLPFISQGITGLADRRLLPAPISLNSLRLPGWEIVRGDDDNWALTDKQVVVLGKPEELIKNWQGLEARLVKRFKSGSTPLQKFTAELENGARQEFFLMSIDPQIIIANPEIGLQYHFDADQYYQLISLRKDETSG